MSTNKIKMFLSSVCPELCTKILFKKNLKYKLNLKNPTTINEKLQYLKLYKYTNNTTVTKCVDKYLVKDYIAKEKNGICKTANLLGVYDDASEINWEILPNKFVIKCNHGCGYNIICDDKGKLDIDQTIKKLNNWMKTDYWKIYCETQYKNVKKKIIIEELLGSKQDVLTYTFWCFNGELKILNIQSLGEDDEEYIDYFDSNWNWLDMQSGSHQNNPVRATTPKKYSEMLKIAKCLSSDFPFVRVDFYYVNEDIYLSELTFVPGGGFFKLSSDEIMAQMSEWLTL